MAQIFLQIRAFPFHPTNLPIASPGWGLYYELPGPGCKAEGERLSSPIKKKKLSP